jgi:tripartite-type tricarboxylate transporter receptor subunit TctC
VWSATSRRWAAHSACIALALSTVEFANAARAGADYPSRLIRLVVPFAAGSATDSVARILALDLSERLGQTVVVENRAGAFGQIAAAHVARSAPDGYTLFLSTNTTHAANPHLFKTLPYDALKDFEPVARVGKYLFMLVVNPALPVGTTAELLAYARAHPGELSYATSNSTSLVSAETINALGKVSMVGVQYKASPQAILDVVGGRVQVAVSDYATAMPHVKAGKLKALGVTTAQRSALLPDVPTIAEALPGFDTTSWAGLFVPAGTSSEIVGRLARETLASLGRPEVKAQLAAIGMEADPLDPQAFGRYVQGQIDYWGKLVRDAHIQPE